MKNKVTIFPKRGRKLKKTYEEAEIKLTYITYDDIITVSGGGGDGDGDVDTPSTGGDVNDELPFMPKR